MNDTIRIYKYYFLSRQDLFAEQLPKGDHRRIKRSIANKYIEGRLSDKNTYATHLVSHETKLSGHTPQGRPCAFPLSIKEDSKAVHDAIIERYEQLMCDVKNK